MSDFVALVNWLRETPASPEPVAIEEPPLIEEVIPDCEPAPEDDLIDDVCARVRRFRAMLADAFDYVQTRGEPQAPLRIRVHPSQLAHAEVIALPLVADSQLGEKDALIELHCGSISARLQVPLERLL
jgi:hypothetical protein